MTGYSSILQPRQATLRDLRRRPSFDVLIHGQGRDCAALAQLCALHGMRTLWCSHGDFSHPLETPPFSISTPFLESGAPLPLCGPHLARDLHPSRSGSRLRKIFMPRTVCEVAVTRLFWERFTVARQEGAHTLNHIELSSLGRTSKGSVACALYSPQDDKRLMVEAALVVAGRKEGASRVEQLALFAGPVESAIACARGFRAAVLPFLGGGVFRSRSKGLLGLPELQRVMDLPALNLLLPPASAPDAERERVASPLPPYSLFSAEQNAERIFGRLLRLANYKGLVCSIRSRPLPGAAGFDSHIDEFRVRMRKRSLPDPAIDGAIARWGARVRFISDESPLLDAAFFLCEVQMVLELEQPTTVPELAGRLQVHDLDLYPELRQAAQARVGAPGMETGNAPS